MRPKKTILCVDDNEQALSVRKFLLETRGYRVQTAASSERALELFREGGIDLVVSDLIMPYMDGNELIRRLKELGPEVPAILISGSVRAFDRANRADAFLPKGACSPVELLERIRVMVARKRGPKKGHGLRAMVSGNATMNAAENLAEHGAQLQPETSDPVVVGV
jgi:two-component system, OmpR family, response regulator CpxR